MNEEKLPGKENNFMLIDKTYIHWNMELAMCLTYSKALYA